MTWPSTSTPSGRVETVQLSVALRCTWTKSAFVADPSAATGAKTVAAKHVGRIVREHERRRGVRDLAAGERGRGGPEPGRRRVGRGAACECREHGDGGER